MVGELVTKTWVTVHVQGMFYKATMQSVLLYGSKIWVVTGYMIKVPEGFHPLGSRRIVG